MITALSLMVSFVGAFAGGWAAGTLRRRALTAEIAAPLADAAARRAVEEHELARHAQAEITGPPLPLTR